MTNQKYSFLDDYSEGCHPNILKALSESNLSQQTAYGNDEYSEKARILIHKQLNNPGASIYFVAGGTLANIIVLASCLRPHEAIISSSTGHIATHETGAIEATGHKIISMPSENGKLSVVDVAKALDDHALVPHMVKPKLVYISNATDVGTIYSKQELQELSAFCKKKDLFLFMDGARLATAITSKKNDLTLEDVSKLTDVFWIGGTKVGALIGEAIVINNPNLDIDFAFHIKQRGAMLAKGRILGIQFQELFSDDLFYKLATYANNMAQKLADGLNAKGFLLSSEIESNQIFPILPNSVISKLEEKFVFYRWQEVDDENTVVRLVTSWATDETKVDEFIGSL